MIRIIIVDDELLAGVGIRTLIDGKENIHVEEVFSEPEEAIDFLRENPVDLVITDIEMGEMSGLDFIRIIRRDLLAPGIIILSCHADFSYAQEAIAQGTDSYLLKHSISGPLLISEIKKVYEKHSLEPVRRVRPPKQDKALTGREIYLLAVLRLARGKNGKEHGVDNVMLTSLLERLVAKYNMGTFFSEYQKELFILFTFEPETTASERREKTESYLDILSKSIFQFTGQDLSFGISPEMPRLQETREAYDQAREALEGSFFRPDRRIFYYRPESEEIPDLSFPEEEFLTDRGMGIFVDRLEKNLEAARRKNMRVSALKNQLLQRLTHLVHHIIDTGHFSEPLKLRWRNDPALGIAVTTAVNADFMKEGVLHTLDLFYRDCRAELKADPLADSLRYVEDHLAEKLSLNELADLACMSVPSFSKHFKERTGQTLVNYINDRRIERAKILLRDEKLTLEEIAEQTGFSTANYLVRVFKKSTGQTISEYRG